MKRKIPRVMKIRMLILKMMKKILPRTQSRPKIQMIWYPGILLLVYWSIYSMMRWLIILLQFVNFNCFLQFFNYNHLQSTEVRFVVVHGLCQLMATGKLKSAKVLSRLILMWFHPSSSKFLFRFLVILFYWIQI